MPPAPRKTPRPIYKQRIDLNLIRLFNAIYQERQVTRAGMVMHMSQSAVSHGLSSLRLMFDDPLFVRTPDGMEPTALADRIAEQVRGPLSDIQQAFSLSNDFDPAEADIDLAIGLTTPLHPRFIAELSRAVRQAAPHSRLMIQSVLNSDVAAGLDARSLDLVVGDIAALGDARRFRVHQLVEDKVVCVIAQSNTEVGEVLDLRTYANLPHLVVAAAKVPHTWIDERLAEKGLKRRIAAVLPSAFYVDQVIPDSPMVCTIMSSLVAKSPRLRFLPPPIRGRAHKFGLVWHARDDEHAPVVWLRELVKTVWDECRSSDAPPPMS